MNIIIHALGAHLGGALRHLTNFLPELGRQDRKRQYQVLVRESIPEIRVPENIRIIRFPDRYVENRFGRLWLDNIILPNLVKKEKADLFITLANFGPVKVACPHIIFQRNPLYFCRYYLDNIGGSLKAETQLRRWLAVEAMKRADLIVTPSDAMADMIKDLCPDMEKRPFHTLYHGFAKKDYGEPLDEKFAKQLNVKRFKLLYPTHPSFHKGFEILFRILARAKDMGADFEFFTTISHEEWPEGVGQYTKQIRELGIEDRVIFMGNIPQKQMGAVYEKCDFMIYPSLCESFGFSMIEAMGHGLPIIAADTLLNREICKDTALYYPSENVEAGANAIMKAFDPDISGMLIEKGLKRFESFDWGWQRYVSEFSEIIGRYV